MPTNILANPIPTKLELRAEREAQCAFVEGLLRWMDGYIVGTFPPAGDSDTGLRGKVRNNLGIMTNGGADPMSAETARHWINDWVEADLKDIAEGAFEALDRFPGDGWEYAAAQNVVDRKMAALTAEAPGFAGMGAQEFFNSCGRQELGAELRQRPTYAPADTTHESNASLASNLSKPIKRCDRSFSQG